MQAMKTSMQIVCAFAMVAGCFHADAAMLQQYKEVVVMDEAYSANVRQGAPASRSSPMPGWNGGAGGAAGFGGGAAGPPPGMGGTNPMVGGMGVLPPVAGAGSPDDLMVAQDPMANHALTGRMQAQMEPQTPAAIKAAQFRRLRNELRAQRRKKEEVKTKLLRLQDLQRQHLLSKAKIDKHGPKVDSRRAKSYLDAALTKLANDMADSRRQLRVIDRAISDLNIEHAKTEARQVHIKRQDAALVVKIKEDQVEVANLDALKKMEAELKKGVDEHRGVATAELSSKVANGKTLQSGLEAQLVNTLATKTLLSNKVFGETYTEDVDKLDIGTNSVTGAISEIKDATSGPLPVPIQPVIDAIPASTQAAIDALPASAAVLREAGPPVQLSEDEQREELEEAELAHAEVDEYSEKAMNPASTAFLEVKK